MNSCRLSPVFGVLSGPHKPPQTQRPCWWLTHGPSLPSSFLPWLWWGLESAFPSLVPGLTRESHPLPLVPTAHNKLTSSLGSQGPCVFRWSGGPLLPPPLTVPPTPHPFPHALRSQEALHSHLNPQAADLGRLNTQAVLKIHSLLSRWTLKRFTKWKPMPLLTFLFWKT